MPAYTFPATANVVALAGLKPRARRRRPRDDEHRPGEDRRRAAHEAAPRRAPLRPAAAAARAARRAAARGRRRRARRALPRPRVRRARHRGLPQLPSAQDRHDRGGRRGHDLRRRVRRRGARSCATTAGARSHRPTCPRPASTTGSRTSSARSASRRCAASTSCSRRARGSPTATPSGSRTCRCCCRARTRATSTAGRPTCSRSTTATACSPQLRAQGIEAQIGTYSLPLLGAYRDQGEFPGARRVFERALALPFHTRLSDADLDRVAEALDKLVSHH